MLEIETDYSFTPVPQDKRQNWLVMGLTKFGQVSALTQFLLGAVLGYGMTFFQAFLAITFGSVILEVIAIGVGIIGARQGLTTSLLTRWTGFGRAGAAIVGAVIAVTSVGWFGIQCGVSANGLLKTLGTLPEYGWALLLGLAITVIVLYGFKMIAKIAFTAVPAFIVLVLWSIWVELQKHSLSDLIHSPPPGPHISLPAGIGMVAGGFIVGAVISSDITRYNRNAGDVIKQTVVGITVGEYLVGLIAVILSHAISSENVMTIIMSSVGWVGILVTILGIVKINDINLYAAVFGIANLLNTIFNRKFNRKIITIVIGIIGSVLGALGILNGFKEFLSFLGILLPPVAAIMIAEYFVVKNWRPELDESRETQQLPPTEPIWIPATLVIWVVSTAVGYFVDNFGIPAINSLIVAFVLYVVAGKLGLIREFGRGQTVELATKDSEISQEEVHV